MICSHKKAYSFHQNAPMYCPRCECYIDGERIIKESEKYKSHILSEKLKLIMNNIKTR